MSREFEEKMNSLIPMVVEQTSKGEKGKRYSLPNSRIMVHQPSAGFQGQATDIQIRTTFCIV